MRVRTDVDNGVADRNPITPRASYPITHRGHRGEGARAVSRDPGGSPAPTIYGVREPAPALVSPTCLIRGKPADGGKFQLIARAPSPHVSPFRDGVGLGYS